MSIFKFKNSLRESQASQSEGACCLIYKDQFTEDDMNAAWWYECALYKLTHFSLYRARWILLMYLRSNVKETLPPLVTQFGLFTDELDLLRHRGTINYTLSVKSVFYYLLTIPG